MRPNPVSAAVIGALLIHSAGCRPSDASTKENLLTAQAGDLKQTIVVATPDAPIAPGTNVIWCGTFQLTWNEACGLIGEDIHFVHEPPMVAELNKKSFTSNEVDSASYVALAGFVKDDIHKKIRDAVTAKFGNSAAPELIPDQGLTPNPDDIVAYAYLFKNLEFAIPFERLATPLNFGGREVAAFGMTGKKTTHQEMASQVIVLANNGRDDFVVELKTKSLPDRLILAKIKPGKTLDETIRIVEDQIDSGPKWTANYETELAVPKFNFDIVRTYGEMEGAHLVVRNPKIGADSTVASAKQDIRFQMDEKGVRLRSEAHFAKTRGIPTYLIFDKPFLLMLKQTNAKNPYFAMWVDNPELLVKR